MLHKIGNNSLKQQIAIEQKEVIRLRRDLHMHPELGFQEFRTSKIVINYLDALGIKTKVIAKTGVVGMLRGIENGPTLLLRADMDALAMQELLEKPYRSINKGVSHACGHDAHVAMLLVAAKILSLYRNELKGNIKFVFQPNEETPNPQGGAIEMVNEGVMEDPKVNAAMAIHVSSDIDTGKIGFSNGASCAGLEEFELAVFGKGGHTSSPNESIDPIIAAAKIVDATQIISTREISVFNPIIIMFGKFLAGSGRNIIPEKAVLGGTIRYLYENEKKEVALLKEKFERVIKGICLATGTRYNLEYIYGNASMYNASEMVKLVKRAALYTLGTEKAILDVGAKMGGEDFSEFGSRVPSVITWLGTRNQGKGTDYPHHHPNWDIDEDALLIGVELHVRSALSYLN